MEELKAILKAAFILILLIVLSIPKIAIWTLKVLEGAVRITRNTITYFIESIEKEVLLQNLDHDRKTS